MADYATAIGTIINLILIFGSLAVVGVAGAYILARRIKKRRRPTNMRNNTLGLRYSLRVYKDDIEDALEMVEALHAYLKSVLDDSLVQVKEKE